MFRLPVLLLVVCLWGVFAIDDDDTDEHWEAFKEKFNKTYGSDEEEREAREQFEKNLLHVALHNVKDEHDYDKDLHEYSDMSEKEQIAVLCQTELPANYSARNAEDFSMSERQLPSSVDWVSAGKVTPVKNQGSCGSCWSFSAAQAVEGQAAQKWNGLWTLSEQQQVDCAGDYGNNGCNGGWPQNAFRYMMAEGGLVQENDYPYTAQEGDCKADTLGGVYHFQLSGYKDVAPSGNEQAVAQALADKGPLTCAIYVSDSFMHYSNGIYKDKTYKNQGVNHGVLLVGFGTENGQDYWKIKNSWGPSWGENGYARIARNYGSHLHIADYTSYPILK